MKPIDFEAELNFGKSYLIKDSESIGTWVVEGYASTSDLDAQCHIVSPEAIKMGAESLKRYDTVLFNHDVNRPIGKVLKPEATDGGLLVKVSISKTEPKIWEQIKDGTLSKFSIRGQILDSEIRVDELTKQETFVILGMELHEISLVSVPANPQARSLSWYIEKALKETAKEKDYREPGESVDDCVKRKIKVNMEHGMPRDQAVAAAHKMCGAAKKSEEIRKDEEQFKEAVEYLESGVEELQGEDKDQVMAIIRSLQALIGRVYSKSIDTKGGQGTVPDKEEVKKDTEQKEEPKEEVKKSQEEEEKKEEVKEEEKKEEVKKSQAEEKISLDLTVLKDVIGLLQGMVKDVTAQTETIKSVAAEVSKGKADIEKMLSDLTTVMKEIPVRKGAAAEKDEPRKEEQKVSESDEFKKANPMNQLHMLIQKAAGEK